MNYRLRKAASTGKAQKVNGKVNIYTVLSFHLLFIHELLIFSNVNIIMCMRTALISTIQKVTSYALLYGTVQFRLRVGRVASV